MSQPRPSAAAPWTLAGTTILPGSKVKLEIPVTRLSTGTELSLPITVLHGRSAGPKLLISAAIHGDELNGVEIVRQVVAGLSARSLRGTVVAAPVVNVFGYLTQSRYLPDRRDLNRSFPGSRGGSLAARLAHLFLNQIVIPCDIGIDCHTGADRRSNMPQIRANLHDPETRDLAMAFGAPVVVQARLRANSLRAAASDRGMPMLVYEAGEALRFDADAIATGVTGIRRLMGRLGMIAEGGQDPVPEPFVAESSSWVRVGRGGILLSSARLGDLVQAGDEIAQVIDIHSRLRARVRAPFDGLIIGQTNHPLVSRGDAVYHLARQDVR